MIYIYDFIKHDMLLSSDFTCITRHIYVLVLYECSTDCCVTSAYVVVFLSNLDIKGSI